MPGRRAFLRRRHVAAGASRADCGPRVPTRGFVAPCSGSGVLEWLCCRAASGARAAGGPARRVGLPPATWGPVIAGTGTGGGSVGTSHTSDSSPRHFPWSGSEYLSTSEVLDVGRFCGVDRLQITCHRRSENPSAVTAKTPQNGLEITAVLRASLTIDRPRSVIAGVLQPGSAARSSRVGRPVAASATALGVSAAGSREGGPGAWGRARRWCPVKAWLRLPGRQAMVRWQAWRRVTGQRVTVPGTRRDLELLIRSGDTPGPPR